MIRKMVRQGDLLIRQGEFSDQMYLLEKGKLRVFVQREGKELTLGFIEANELVGELSFLDKDTRSANVVAEVDSQVVEIPREVFNKILSEQPAWVAGLIRTLASRLREANKKIRV